MIRTTKNNNLVKILAAVGILAALFSLTACGDVQIFPKALLKGEPGKRALVRFSSADVSQCAFGGQVIAEGSDDNGDSVLTEDEVDNSTTICNGLPGLQGLPGVAGTNGLDGLPGTSGQDASLSPYTVTAYVMPCATDPYHPTNTELSNPMYEVLLVMANGQILSSFSENIDGKNTHFAVVPPGTYQSTGAGNCVFTVNADGSVTK